MDAPKPDLPRSTTTRSATTRSATTRRTTTRRTLGLTLLAAAVLLGAGHLALRFLEDPSTGPPPNVAPAAVAEAGPVGPEAYDRALERAAGQAVDAAAFAALARDAARELEDRLDRLAVEAWGLQDSGKLRTPEPADWRSFFATLLQQHAGDDDAVLEAYRAEIERQGEFLRRLDLVPLPPRGVEVVEIDNPVFRRYFSLAMYLDGRLGVTLAPAPGATGAEEGAEADYLVNHCRACLPPLVAHEVWPGHHVAYSRAEVVPPGPERLASNRDNVVYHEGWALYAELLMLEAGYYDADPALELGAWRMLYLRAVRAFVDAALHLGDMTPEAAERLYRDEVRLTPGAAHAEVARHMKDPVLKASYFLGLVQILELRRRLEVTPEGLGAFHDSFLGRPRPIPELAREVFNLEAEALPTQVPPELTSRPG